MSIIFASSIEMIIDRAGEVSITSQKQEIVYI